MRIISPFHDYYDCIQAYGRDQSFIYHRKPETVELNEYPFPKMGRCALTHHLHIIGFCGKIYPMISIYHGEGLERRIAYSYQLSEVDEFVEKYYDKKTNKIYFSKKWSWHILTRKRIKKYFDECANQQNNHEKIFRDSGQPIFITGSHTNENHKFEITYNCQLKKYRFFKIFNTESTYQEISMYLGGVLGQNNPTIPEISNNGMIEAKGFDLKTSFRKEKKSRR